MKKIKNEFEKRLMNEEIALPESLSAENIERLINEKGGIIEPHRKRNYNTKAVLKWCAAAAASIVMIIGIGAAIDSTSDYIEKNEQQEVIENQVVQSDYSEIEKTVLNYFKDIYNNRYSYTNDSFNFGAALDGFLVKEEGAADLVAPGDSVNNASKPSAPTTGTGDAGDNKHSTTNTQVSGVDEADIIKNDGRYIYYLHDNFVTITDCADAENMQIISEIKLFGESEYDMQASEMYLYEDSLVVILKKSVETIKYYDHDEELTGVAGDSIKVDSYCCCYAPRYDTIIRIYNISDIKNPEMTFTHKICGDYISSRVTDDRLLTVVRYEIPYNYIEAEKFEDYCTVLKDNCIPTYSVNDGAMKRIESECITMFDQKKPTSYTVTSVIDLDSENKEPTVDAFLGGGTEVYCTQNEIFIAESMFSYWMQDKEEVVKDVNGTEFTTATRIHKLDITNEGVNYNTSTVVGGIWLNQFSMDKYGDYFRIATNGSKYRGGESCTMVYVFDKDMKIVGFLDGIAKGEDMKSARFLGNTLYLVTFFQTDPLFVVDLTDPTKPEVKGELKIPGFSSYLHPIGNGLVIGIGEGGTMNGTDGSAKVSLFDVSDPCNPKELDNYVVSDSYFLSDHKAFMTVDEDTFGIPLIKYNYNGYQTSEMLLIDISGNGIEIAGRFSGRTKMYSYSTWQMRGAFINENLFVVNSYGIVSYNMETEEMLCDLAF